jgi:hypothetical protein
MGRVGLRAVLGLTAFAVAGAIAGPAVQASAAALPTIEGAVTCPSPAEVAHKLRPLLGDGGLGEAGDRVRLAHAESALQVSLIAADGRVRGIRNVDERHDCDELAEAAAIIVASWQGAPPVAETRAPVASAIGSAGIARTGSGTVAPDEPRAWLGLGVAGSGAAENVAPGMALEADLDLRGLTGRHGLGLHLRGLLDGLHTEPLARGDALWRRSALSLGPSWSWASPDVVLEADLSAAAGLLTLGGSGFADNQSHTLLDFGALAGVRVRGRGGLGLFAGIGAGFWPRRTIATQAPDQDSSALPRWQWLLEAGLGWGR